MVSFLESIEVNNFCFFEKIEKSEFRAVIKHLDLIGLTPKLIKAELYAVHDESAPVFTTVYNWINEFKCDRTSTKGVHRSRHRVEGSTPEMISKIHDMVLSDQRIKLYEVVEVTGASKDAIVLILHDNWIWENIY